MKSKMTRNLAGILLVVGMLSVFSVIILAEEFNFAGTWRGEYNPAAGAPAPPAGAAPAPSGGRGGGFGGGAGGGGPQQVTLRVKVNKEGKASGNFSMKPSGGNMTTDDVREGHVEGNKLTFKTGASGQQIYDNVAVMIGADLAVTRTPAGGRGGRPMEFTLKHDM